MNKATSGETVKNRAAIRILMGRVINCGIEVLRLDVKPRKDWR